LRGRWARGGGGAEMAGQEQGHELSQNYPPHIHYLLHMTPSERHISRRFFHSLTRSNSALAGPSCQQPHLWRSFVKYNSRTQQEEFHPDLFLEPLRSLLEFVDALSQTQHFTSFLDSQRRKYAEQEEARRVLCMLLGRAYRRWRGRGEGGGGGSS